MPDELNQRLRTIDKTTRELHWHLSETDEVLYWREYTSDRDYSYSNTNQLIANLKKEPTRPPNQLRHKEEAITRTANYFSSILSPRWLAQATLVPVPCSKAKGHAEYDDRMTRICRGIRFDNGKVPDVRELVTVTQSMVAAHKRTRAERRPTVGELEAIYRIDETLANPAPTIIGIVDDVITAGTHFRAMSNLLRRRFPNTKIIGLFVARRVFPPVA